MHKRVRIVGELGQRQKIVGAEAAAVFPRIAVLIQAAERHAVHRSAVVTQVNFSLPDRGTNGAVPDRVYRPVWFTLLV